MQVFDFIIKIINVLKLRECFIENMEHKFKANLRIQLNLKKNEKILICLSGGINSIAMAKMVIFD